MSFVKTSPLTPNVPKWALWKLVLLLPMYQNEFCENVSSYSLHTKMSFVKTSPLSPNVPKWALWKLVLFLPMYQNELCEN